MFNFIKEKIKKVYESFTCAIGTLFSKNTLDEHFFEELKVLLLQADAGVTTTQTIIDKLRSEVKNNNISSGPELKSYLNTYLLETLNDIPSINPCPRVLLMVGINGSGKTTFCAKYAHKLACEGKKVLLVAADTFRAAAVEQLCAWAEKINVTVHTGREGQDPASVVFDGCKMFVDQKYDHIIIDTAGRLQTKTNLMKELAKIRKITQKIIPDEPIATWLTIDAMLGQNSFDQAKLFHESTDLSAIVLTKFDGTGKGGIIFAIAQEIKLGISYITYGEQLEDLRIFDAQQYVQDLMS